MIESELVQNPSETVRERLRNMTRFKVGEAALLAGKSPPTLGRAVKSGKLSVTKDESGERLYDASELERVYGKLNFDALGGGVQNPELVQVDEIVHGVSSKKMKASSGVSVDESNPAVKVLLQEQEIKHQKATIDRLEKDVETWQAEVGDWKSQLEDYKFRLTDEREESEKLKSKLASEQARATRSKAPLVAAVALVVAAGAVAFALYPDTVRELLKGQGATTVDAVALEVVPELEPVATIEP